MQADIDAALMSDLVRRAQEMRCSLILARTNERLLRLHAKTSGFVQWRSARSLVAYICFRLSARNHTTTGGTFEPGAPF